MAIQTSPCALTLRPVTAHVVSYGRSATMAQRATLYVLRVSRGGREWYVARRYSEFRMLDNTLRDVVAHPHPGRSTMCAQCRELAHRLVDVAFPSRFIMRSHFASSREKIESERLQQLDAFVQVLMETTQGLLATQDDEDEDDEEYDMCGCTEDEREDRCDALRIIREFLLVHDNLSPENTKTTSERTTSSESLDTPHRARLGSSNSLGATTTFRVKELDVIYRPTSPSWVSLGSSSDLTIRATSPNILDDHELDELFLADYASPAEDAVIHRQMEVVDGLNAPAMHLMGRTESLRMSRRL